MVITWINRASKMKLIALLCLFQSCLASSLAEPMNELRGYEGLGVTQKKQVMIMETLPLRILNETVGDDMMNAPSNTLTNSSTNPTIHKSLAPSSSPSIPPSQSLSPTNPPPTDLPSATRITSEPSISLSPTLYPTKEHSSHPSAEASASPSASISPTMAPTPECHDLAAYRSPIYDLACSKFNHPAHDCLDWINVGFDEEAILTLLRSCPVSCGVPCGYSPVPSTSPSAKQSLTPTMIWDTITVGVEFYIQNAAEKINDAEKAKFEKISLQYLSDAIDGVNTILISFNITDQKVLNYRRRSLRAVRNLDGEAALYLKASVSALTSGEDPISSDKLINKLVNSIDDEGYGKILATELPDNSLVITSISDVPSKGDDGVGRQHNSNRESGSAAFLISTVVAVSVVAIGIGFLYRRRAGLKRFMNLSSRHRRGDELSDGSHEPGSYDDEISFDDGMNTVDHSFLSRVLSRSNSPLGLSPRTSEVEDTDINLQKDHCRNANHHLEQLYPHQSIQEENMVTTKKNIFPSAAEEPPMSHNHIPPMIVIDNIDDEALPPQTSKSSHSVEEMEATPSKSHHEGYDDEDNHNGMAVRRIEATSDLLAVFSAKKAAKPLQAYNLWHPFMEDKSDTDARTDECGSPQTHLSSRLSLGGASSISTPNTAKVEDEGEVPKKKSIFNFDPESKMEDEDDFAIQFEKKMKEGDRDKPLLPRRTLKFGSLFKRKKSQNDEKNGGTSSLPSYYESDAGSSDGSSVLRERDRIEETNQAMLPKHYPDMNMAPHMVNDEEDSKLQDDSDSESSDDEGPVERHVDLKRESKHHRRISSGSNILIHTHKRAASESSFTSGFIYSFLAPCSGKLGIIIQSKPSSAPTIFQVKDYSPLLGQVEPGDKIVAVDGDDTSKMSTSEITTLLAMKRSSKNDKTQRIKVTVMSKYKKEGIQPEREGTLAEHFTYEIRDDGNGYGGKSSQKSHAKQREEDILQEAKYDYSSSDDQSCHLIGTVNTDDNDDSFHMMGGGADDDQFL